MITCALLVISCLLVLSAGRAWADDPLTRTTDPLIAAAGDIACDPTSPYFNGGNGERGWCRAARTAAVIAGIAPDAVLSLGDAQYNAGTAGEYEHSYRHSWGSFLPITFPTPGNHDYYSTPTATGYFRYFEARAVPPGASGLGYYSYDLGAWHLISLNSNCTFVRCGTGSKQYRWLRDDLTASASACTLAYWHAPRYSSGPHGNDVTLKAIWHLLYRQGVDVVLAGHDHIYERFRQLDASGSGDRAFGLREFVVGTGGAQHYWIQHVQPGSVVRDAKTFGVLEMTLHPDGYDWRFMPVAGETFRDRGTSTCHGPPV